MKCKKSMARKVINFEKEQEKFLSQVKNIAIDSIAESGYTINDIEKLFPEFEKENNTESYTSSEKDSDNKYVEDSDNKYVEDSERDVRLVNDDNKNNETREDDREDEYEYKGVEISTNKNISIFRIISKRYMIKFYTK